CTTPAPSSTVVRTTTSWPPSRCSCPSITCSSVCCSCSACSVAIDSPASAIIPGLAYSEPPCFYPVEFMNFAIALLAGPQDPAARSALEFARAVLAGGHQISRLFFYRDAVQLASQLRVTPQDEMDITAEWQQFIHSNQLDAVVCIAAALRRGVLNTAEAQRWNRPA